jgi:hypothetical protein
MVLTDCKGALVSPTNHVLVRNNKGVTTEWVEKKIQEPIKAPIWRRLDLHEVLDGLLAKYYALEADVKEIALDDAN